MAASVGAAEGCENEGNAISILAPRHGIGRIEKT
jgi:hypothetical protein